MDSSFYDPSIVKIISRCQFNLPFSYIQLCRRNVSKANRNLNFAWQSVSNIFFSILLGTAWTIGPHLYRLCHFDGLGRAPLLSYSFKHESNITQNYRLIIHYGRESCVYSAKIFLKFMLHTNTIQTSLSAMEVSNLGHGILGFPSTPSRSMN